MQRVNPATACMSTIMMHHLLCTCLLLLSHTQPWLCMRACSNNLGSTRESFTSWLDSPRLPPPQQQQLTNINHAQTTAKSWHYPACGAYQCISCKSASFGPFMLCKACQQLRWYVSMHATLHDKVGSTACRVVMSHLKEGVIVEREVQTIWELHRQELLGLDAGNRQDNEHHLSSHTNRIDEDRY